MSVIVTDMVFPKECGECEWFCFEGITCTTPQYYLDARCRRIPSGQDWYGEDRRGGWIGKSIAHLPGYGGRYPHEHCIEFGTRPENCPLIELPKHGDLIDRDEAIKTIGKLAELMEEKCGYENAAYCPGRTSKGENMKNCPYCYREDRLNVQPHYTKHMTDKGETYIAYCPVCGARTPYFRGGKVKTLEQAKSSWNAYDLVGMVCPDDVPMQTFCPD